MELSTPRSAVAGAAADLSRAACPTFLDRHNHRTFHLGMLLVDDAQLDVEATFVASMLHDLGLTDAHRGDVGFDDVGAELACRFLVEQGWDRERIRLVEQAILWHTRLDPNEAPEHRVVQAGAALDVAGVPAEFVGSDEAKAVFTAYPRDDFARRMRELFLDEVERHPDGSFAKLQRQVSLADVMLLHRAEQTR